MWGQRVSGHYFFCPSLFLPSFFLLIWHWSSPFPPRTILVLLALPRYNRRNSNNPKPRTPTRTLRIAATGAAGGFWVVRWAPPGRVGDGGGGGWDGRRSECRQRLGISKGWFSLVLAVNKLKKGDIVGNHLTPRPLFFNTDLLTVACCELLIAIAMKRLWFSEESWVRSWGIFFYTQHFNSQKGLFLISYNFCDSESLEIKIKAT